MKARKLPVEIEYYPCEMEYIDDIMNWSTKERPIRKETRINAWRYIYITTLEWEMTAKEWDIIIKGVNWEVYPCKKDIFEKTYELI